ncbi:MAG: NAD(P)-dependent oxidoreductase [Muribaculaceae bacterium]|nr:NAD(P)-dependent oxidoreductase [Muribaculaceae bacterium]
MVIVIGASGFIGTYLVDGLVKNGFEVVATGRNPKAVTFFEGIGVEYVQLDIARKKDFDRLPTENVEAVILLAALLPANVTDENPYEYIDTNVNGTVNVLEYCLKNNIKKLISTTSYADVKNLWSADSQIQSDSLRDFSLDDDHTLYIITKNAATDIMLYYNNKYNMECSIFRLPPVYGVGPHSGLFVNGIWKKSGFQIFIDNAVEGKPITIFGDSTVVRDIVHVKDVVQAFIKAIRSNKAKGVYNIGSGEASSIEQQARDVVEVFSVGKKSDIVFDPGRPNQSRSYRMDISKAARDFGYSPEFVPFIKLVKEYKRDLESPSIDHLKNQYKK